ncbi:rod linker polypeptide (Lr)/ C-phycoerythrin II-associated (C-phycoerythrin II gamma subunit) [Synechococcus sp. A15-127]|uniref:phycobilisome rod-core linker polypeptide n=1 Tax=Synechococcus sp. A15-127 TaxID=1050624 RepID=UPI0016463DE5|nr:phycobilisome rod-core linker polypeptide [Synechococcus sp. A15-127]QNI93600.1 rod linker polypeptide (Lr)/ C-phycoerythrin II-associated (C-phycoerythrin II gamma subunit) [Synechococcus sp. A15-127]
MLSTQTSPEGMAAANRTKPASYSMASKAGKNTVHRTVAGSIAEFKRNTCSTMGLGIGPRLHSECPFGSVFDEYHPNDSAALERTIIAAYRQVYGNLPPTENERCTSLEVRLMNGEITVRDFVNGLAKSPFYKQNYFHSVAPQRGIELNFKHLLGRAPLNQAEIQKSIKLQAEEGFDALIDSLTDCAEYAEVFGSDIVPNWRTADSYAGMMTSSFNMMRELASTKVAVSDNAQGSRSRTLNPLATAAAKASRPVTFTYQAVAKPAARLPQQQYSGHQPPKQTGYVAFRPFGIHF